MTESALTKNRIISELTKSPHGDLKQYVPLVRTATMAEPEFMAHLIAWNAIKGQVRDAKVALPVISLSVAGFHQEFVDNSLAHINFLGLRELARAYRFALELKVPGRMRSIRRMVESKLQEIESDIRVWDRVAVLHKNTLKELIGFVHHNTSPRARAILFEGSKPKGSVFEAISQLKNMDALTAAGTIIGYKIPFLIAQGALGKRATEPDLALALIERMSPTELVTNTKMLERLGVKTNPALRGAYEQAIERAGKSKSKNTLKTTRAAAAISDEGLKEKLHGLQEKQIAKLSGVDGNWLVLGDKSPSMEKCIEVARHVAATLAKFVKGKVHLVFFDSAPRHFEVSGKSYDQIMAETKHVLIGGGTSIGCGVQYVIEYKFDVDGIAVVSDAQENTAPAFVDRYQKLCQNLGKEIPVYLYRFEPGMRGFADRDLATSMSAAGIDLQEFDLRKGVDYYSLPNLVQTMRTNRYSLVDEIMATKLYTLDDVFKSQGKEVEANVGATS